MSDDERHLLVETKNKICYLTLNRPDIHNAFDDALINELIDALKRIEKDSSIRVVILRSNGKSFSAGADLNWMKRMSDYSEAQNQADSMKLAELMFRLNHLNKPTIALVQGATFGGAVGLVACCDIAIATQHAKFCLSEVKIGLIPAVISPYVIRAIGERQARRYFLSAELITAERALNLGLIHELSDDLESKAHDVIHHLLHNSPQAIIEAKRLIETNVTSTFNQELIEETANRIASIRVTEEGQEGLNAFLEKRQPNWIEHDS